MDDHDLLIRIDERVGEVVKQLRRGEETFKAHNTRIGKLEAWRNRIVGAIGILSFIIIGVIGMVK